MDLNDVIARYQARLNEHRRFLEAGDTERSDSQNTNDTPLLSPSANTNAAAMNERRVDVSLFTSPRDADERPRCLRPTKSECDEGRTWQKHKVGIHKTVSEGSSGVSSRREMVQRCLQKEAANDYDSDRLHSLLNNPRVSLPHGNSRDPFAEEDRLFDQQLKAAGRYYVTKSDAMYTRSQLWLENRERSLQQLYEERLRESLEACLFQPKCGSSTARSRSSGCGRAAVRVCEDPSVAAHTGRLREARRRRAEAERRLRGAGTWRNRPTVPKEFVLGRRVTAIPSLRRPFVGVVPLHDGSEEKEEGGRRACLPGPNASQQCEHSETKREKEEEEKEGGDNAGNVTADRPVEMRDATETDGGEGRLPGSVLSLEATIARLQEEVAKRDEMLRQQREELTLLKRELAAAREAVRNLSSPGVVVVDIDETESRGSHLSAGGGGETEQTSR